eukprot:5893805-Pyramimonas_sp.AAC.1
MFFDESDDMETDESENVDLRKLKHDSVAARGQFQSENTQDAQWLERARELQVQITTSMAKKRLGP